MTIEEMAEKEFPIKSWNEYFAANDCRRVYCMGANAVLREIEMTLSVSEEGCLESNLKKLIEELKKG